ncbi:MAG: hypothetical protein K2X01_09850 [Cyanobacteria bacterium]|nr:hypothetical protein [Cyanobacteriota bacterium]
MNFYRLGHKSLQFGSLHFGHISSPKRNPGLHRWLETLYGENPDRIDPSYGFFQHRAAVALEKGDLSGTCAALQKALDLAPLPEQQSQIAMQLACFSLLRDMPRLSLKWIEWAEDKTPQYPGLSELKALCNEELDERAHRRTQPVGAISLKDRPFMESYQSALQSLEAGHLHKALAAIDKALQGFFLNGSPLSQNEAATELMYRKSILTLANTLNNHPESDKMIELAVCLSPNTPKYWCLQRFFQALQ